MEIFFLPPIYIATLFVSAVLVGLMSDFVSDRVILGSGVLFTIFTVSQLIYRILENAMPERLIGQLVYFLLFLLIVFVAKKVKARLRVGREA